MNSIRIEPLGWAATFRDFLFALIADPLSIPLTHPWNRVRLSHGQWEHLLDDPSLTVFVSGDLEAMEGYYPIRSHIRFLGGWKRYVVLSASVPSSFWHVGWIVPDGKGGEICEVSRIILNGRVRTLIGPYYTRFFAVDAKSGDVVSPSVVGRGFLGKEDPNRDITLL